MLYNSTVSLQSVQLNTDIVDDDRLTRPLAISDLQQLDCRTDSGTSHNDEVRRRQISECTDGTITPPYSSPVS